MFKSYLSKRTPSYLGERTQTKSIREHYYTHSSYIAEFFCTLSNIGFFWVAYYHSDLTTFLAGLFSALSHAIPSQRLHDLDLVGVGLVFIKVIRVLPLIMQNKYTMICGMLALIVNLVDTLITRRYLQKVGPSLHVIWHLSAAYALHQVNGLL